MPKIQPRLKHRGKDKPLAFMKQLPPEIRKEIEMGVPRGIALDPSSWASRTRSSRPGSDRTATAATAAFTGLARVEHFSSGRAL